MKKTISIALSISIFVLFFVLKYPTKAFASDADKRYDIAEETVMKNKLFAPSAKQANQSIVLDSTMTAMDKSSMLDVYSIDLTSKEDTQAFLIVSNNIPAYMQSPSVCVPVKTAGSKTYNALAKLVKNGTTIKALPSKYSYTNIFPLSNKVKIKLRELDLTGLSVTANYVWFEGYEFGGYVFFDKTKTRNWVFLLTQCGKTSPLTLTEGQVYSRAEIEDEISSKIDTHFDVSPWSSIWTSYYSASKTYSNRKFSYQKGAEDFHDTVGINKTNAITELFTLQFKNKTYDAAQQFFANYEKGTVVSNAVSTRTFAIPVILQEEKGDAVFSATQSSAIKVTQPASWWAVNVAYRVQPGLKETLENGRAIFKMKEMGFVPERTKAMQLEIPHFSETGVLFYDGTKELYMCGDNSLGHSYYTKYGGLFTMDDINTILTENRDYYVPDKDGNTKCAPWAGYAGKPVIYLYPEETTEVTVDLNFDGAFHRTIPAYENGGWTVLAKSNGTLINKKDNVEYPYIFWDGYTNHKWNMDKGFVVEGDNTEVFLREKLSYMGLNSAELEGFIEYWVPQMTNNPYNVISFTPPEEYAQVADMVVSPQPQSILRIHMAWKGIDTPIQIPEQRLEPFLREGFVLVEWGGTEVK